MCLLCWQLSIIMILPMLTGRVTIVPPVVTPLWVYLLFFEIYPFVSNEPGFDSGPFGFDTAMDDYENFC